MKILLPTDGSPKALSCIDALTCRSFPKETFLHLISVYDEQRLFSNVSLEHAQHAIDKTIIALGGSMTNLQITTEILQGKPAQKIIDIAHEWHADMIIMGVNSRSDLETQTQPLGKVVNEVLERCQSSLTIIRTDNSGKYRREKKHLICIDETITSNNSWLVGKEHMWPSDSEFLLLNVMEPPIGRGSENPRKDAEIFLTGLGHKREEILQIVQEQIGFMRKLYPNNAVDGKVIEAFEVTETILKLAKSWAADMIIMNPHKHSSIEKLLIGSVSHSVSKLAHCSIQIIR